MGQSRVLIPNVIPTQYEIKTEKHIGFFDRNNIYTPIKFSIFKRTVEKINKR